MPPHGGLRGVQAEDLFKEIKALQGELADLNLMSEQIDHHVDVADVNADTEELKSRNDAESEAVDGLFAKRTGIEAKTKGLEADIAAERSRAAALADQLGPEDRAAYDRMSADNARMGKAVAEKEGALQQLDEEIAALEAELRHNTIKGEAVGLYKHIAELEHKRDGVQRELDENYKGTPEEQRERYLEAVKRDNQEISAMERRIAELQTRTSELEAERTDLEGSGAAGGGRGPSDETKAKYLDLQKRDQVMQIFLDGFEEEKAAEIAKVARAEEEVLALLEKIARCEQRAGNMPSREEAMAGKEQLEFKQRQLTQSASTAKGLAEVRGRKEQDLRNVSQLETKIQSQLAEFKAQIDQMETEMVSYNDLEGLRKASEAEKDKLRADKERLLYRKTSAKQAVDVLSARYEGMKSSMASNPTAANLEKLEREWQALEAQNFKVKQVVASRESESHYKQHVATVQRLIKQHNGRLKTMDTTRAVSKAM